MFIASLVLVTAALVAVVGVCTRKAHKPAIKETGSLGALVLTGRIGEGKPLSVTTGMTPRVAPLSAPTSVLRLHASNGVIAYDIAAADVVLIRVLSQGKTVFTAGSDRRSTARTWHVGDMAGWEIQVIAIDGTVLHAFGAPGARIDADIARLMTRMNAVEVMPTFASLAAA
ncbi:MAG: hypothetical protein ACTHMS_11110 [Jatrophihabitans sp.]|uniref:hypothetical protein n=1 Tax=Jatrophihabitans sp. TaxID=1932789 RepID=UPI003F810859